MSPRGIRNNNPLNIVRGVKWQGLRPVQTDPRFCQFETMMWGVRAGIRLMRNHIDGRVSSHVKSNTIRKLVYVWAPPHENNSYSYVQSVSRMSGLHPDQRLFSDNRRQVCAVAEAMIRVECGQPVDYKIIEAAFDLS